MAPERERGRRIQGSKEGRSGLLLKIFTYVNYRNMDIEEIMWLMEYGSLIQVR